MFNSPRFRKIIRDLWNNKIRTLLVVLSIAVGVFAFASVFTGNTLLISYLDEQYKAINPSSINFSVSDFDDSLLAWAIRQPEVKAVQGRSTRLVKLHINGQTSLLTVTAFDTYEDMTANKINFLNGAKPPGINEVLLERTTLAKINLSSGDALTIETPDGALHDLIVSGTVHDLNAIPANIFPQYTAYISKRTMSALGLGNNFNELMIIANDDYKNNTETTALAEILKKRIEDKNYLVSSYEAKAPNQHWAKDVMQAFVVIMVGIGIFSLILSGFLVVNTMTSLIAREKRQIGIMKAIGASRNQVMVIYLGTVVVYGILALFVAVPIGLILAYVDLVFVTGFLNIDIIHFYLPLPVFLLEIAAAVVIPLLASFVPVLKGTGLTVSSALIQFTLKTRARFNIFEKILYSVRNLPRVYLISVRNTFVNSGRLILTLSTLVTAGVLFVSVINVRGALTKEMENSLKVQNYDIRLIMSDWYGKDEIIRAAAKNEYVAASEAEIYAPGKIFTKASPLGSSITLIGIKPGSDFILPIMTQGRWLAGGDRRALVMSSQVMSANPDLVPGGQVTIKINDKNYQYTLVGALLVSGNGDPIAYTDTDSLEQIMGTPNLTRNLAVRLKPTTLSQQTIADNISESMKNRGYIVSGTVTNDTIKQSNQGQFDFLVGFLLSMAVMVAMVGGLGLTGTMSLNVLERTREIGIMRGIGASDAIIRKIVLVEGIVIGIVSWVITIPLSIPISYAFGALIGMAFVRKPLVFSYSVIGVFIWLVIVIFISALAGLLPAMRAAGMSVRDAIAYE